jgi:hypothetical protein
VFVGAGHQGEDLVERLDQAHYGLLQEFSVAPYRRIGQAFPLP